MKFPLNRQMYHLFFSICTPQWFNHIIGSNVGHQTSLSHENESCRCAQCDLKTFFTCQFVSFPLKYIGDQMYVATLKIWYFHIKHIIRSTWLLCTAIYDVSEEIKNFLSFGTKLQYLGKDWPCEYILAYST